MTAASHSPRFEELLPAFALGALDSDELREVEAHLAGGCPGCEVELRRLASDLEELAAAASEIEPLVPGGDLRRHVLALVAAEPRGPLAPPDAALPQGAPPQPAPSQSEPPPLAAQAPVLDFGRRRRLAAARWPLLAAAALLLVAVWGVVRQASLGSEIRQLRGERDQLAARADSLERRIAQVQAQSERLARTLSVIAAPGVQSVSLAAMGRSRAAGRTYVDAADRKAVFVAFDLPALGPDKTYQLWYIDDEDRKTSAGVFGVDARGKASLMVDQPLPVERIQAWVVTVEPRGGRPQPTGPIALAG
jgi:hypothetical protein